MIGRSIFCLLASFVVLSIGAYAQGSAAFEWPQGKVAAVSLTFDDARHSQVEKGTALLDRFDAKATFYIVPGAAQQRLDGWRRAVRAGHEIGNHSINHPCSGNFLWAREYALETYSLEKMKEELQEASRAIHEMLGVMPASFAYPCGQTFIGSGTATASYVPIVAELFSSGRGWLDEAPNDPSYVDTAQLTGMEMDGKDFEEVLPLLENAKADGLWLVLAGHEMDEDGRQTTRLAMLEKLIPYLQDPANGFWLATVGEVVAFLEKSR